MASIEQLANRMEAGVAIEPPSLDLMDRWLLRDPEQLAKIHAARSEYFDVITNPQTDRLKWLQARHNGIGASEAPAVMGVGKWESPYTVWLKKMAPPPEDDDPPNEAAEMGHWLEPVVAAVFQARTGYRTILDGSLLRSKKYPFMTCTLDAWSCVNGVWVPNEIKTTGAWLESDWEHGTPPFYMPQIRHQHVVVGPVERSFNACLIGGQRFVWDEHFRNEQEEALLIARARRFWSYVTDGEAPPIDGHRATEEALKAAHPIGDKSMVVELDEAFIEAADEIDMLKGQAKSIEEKLRKAQNEVRAALGDAELGRLPNGSEFRYRTAHGKHGPYRTLTFKKAG